MPSARLTRAKERLAAAARGGGQKRVSKHLTTLLQIAQEENGEQAQGNAVQGEEVVTRALSGGGAAVSGRRRNALLSGDWLLLTSYKPAVPLHAVMTDATRAAAVEEVADAAEGEDENGDEDDTSFTSLDSWSKYFFSGGPSPLQKVVTGSNRGGSVRVYQRLQLPADDMVAGGAFLNMVRAVVVSLCV